MPAGVTPFEMSLVNLIVYSVPSAGAAANAVSSASHEATSTVVAVPANATTENEEIIS